MDGLDFINSLFAWYQSYSFIAMPLLISIFILGISLGIFQITDDRFFRLGLIVPVGGILLALSFFTGEYGAELFLNLSMQVFMTLIAVLIVALASQLENWFIPIIMIAITAVGLQLFTPVDNIGSNIPVTFSTAIIGSLMVAFMLRQEWAWSPVMKERRLSAAMRKARQEQAEKDTETGDYFMLISGHDEDEIEQRIDFLKQNDMAVIRDNPVEYDDESENYYRLINVKIETTVKNQEAVFLQNKEARIQVLAFPDTVKRIYQQIGEVLNARNQQRIESPNEQMMHIEFKADTPQKFYSAVLEEKIYALARQWQYGEDESLQKATDDLLEWAKSEGLVQK